MTAPVPPIALAGEPVAWVDPIDLKELGHDYCIRFGASATLYPSQGDPAHGFVPLFAAPTPSTQAEGEPVAGTLTMHDVQKKAIEHGFKYWRAPDAHGVSGTKPQAIELLQYLLGVEVEIEDNGCPACDGTGMIGGPSFYAPDEGGEPCPDIAASTPSASSVPVAIPKDFVPVQEWKSCAWKDPKHNGEHDPWYVLLPNHVLLKLGYHADDEIDKAHAEFIAEAINRAIAAPPANTSVGSVPVAVKVFGTGAQLVIEGTFDGEHAVVICPAKQPGEVGASAKREGPVTDDSLVDAVVLTFPTAEQVERVANALVAAPPASPAPSATPETAKVLTACISELKAWMKTYGQDLRSIAAVDGASALLQANGATK